MANKHRGEVDIAIAGKSYTVAMTLDAMARVASDLGCETLGDVERRVVGLKLADFKPILKAVLAGNGHDVPDVDIARLHFRAYADMIIKLWNAKPEPDEDEAPVSPLKRAS